ncbi:MAG: hypothetical protein Q4G00_13595 [Clostridia bacterium]|nr:hypothetical protein [Clostridia bacterium]
MKKQFSTYRYGHFIGCRRWPQAIPYAKKLNSPVAAEFLEREEYKASATAAVKHIP